MANKWQKPELIILYRARPEEAILTHCKHKNVPATQPIDTHDDCNEVCNACQSNANRS
jgi:hypothetical protein